MKGVLVESVQSALDSIIENYKTPPEIEITQGSEEGDGYVSKTYSISIKNDNGKNTELFVKYLPDEIKPDWKIAFVESYNTEYNFYTDIYPVFNQFQQSNNVKKPFNNVPKHFDTKIKNDQTPPIVMEDLRSLGYTLRDRKKLIDDAHLILPIKAFARYHAINYAMKDQQPEKYKKLTTSVGDVFAKYYLKFGIRVDTIKSCIDQLMYSFDPILDKKIMEHSENVTERLIDYRTKVFDGYDEYFIIGQGDCWSNNMMFLYNNETGFPIDVKLIDWQCERISSPLLDFSYFFCTLATKKELDNAENYLKLYYDILSERITELGSDPQKVFPYQIFRIHWRKYSLFGLCMAFSIFKLQLFEKDEVLSLLNPNSDLVDAFSVIIKNHDIYVKRMRDLIETL